MKYINKILTFIIFAVIFSACNRDEIFEREMYKSRVSLNGVLTNGFNVFLQQHDLTPFFGTPLKSEDSYTGWTSAFIAGNVGGSLPTEQDIVLTIVEDMDLLFDYNWTNYELEDFRYARALSKDRYQIPDMKIVIPAGQRAGVMEFRVRLEGLSPDTVYFLPLRIEHSSAYEVNHEKSSVLYRAQIRNEWATQSPTVDYAHRGFILETERLIDGFRNPLLTVDGDTIRPQRTPTYRAKRVVPLSRNEIRLNVGNEATSTARRDDQEIPRLSIKITIEDYNPEIEYLTPSMRKVTITQWNPTHIGPSIIQVDDDYYDKSDLFLNTYELIEDDFGRRYHTFRLCYDYIVREPQQGLSEQRRIWEELRFQYIEVR